MFRSASTLTKIQLWRGVSVPLRYASAPPKDFFHALNNKLDVSTLTIEKTPNPKKKYSDKANLVFGREFTDHMLEIEWNQKDGWGKPKIVPFHDLVLHPASSCLHYALECFEGMKAYKDNKDRVRLFRPEENMKRFKKSAARAKLPVFPEEALLHLLKEFVKVDKDWIPYGKGYSLYLRPTLISTQNTLGVGPASAALLYVIASPVGPYYPSGFKPVRLLADDANVRAWPGGTGGHKLGANYAGTILPQSEASSRGYAQILWLFGDKVTEVGTMNMFVFWKNKEGQDELVTPPLDGTILPGVTRDSILQLCRQWGEFEVTEREFTIHEMAEAAKEGRLHEAFGAGTAAIVSPIESISYKGSEIKVPIVYELGAGKLAKRIIDRILEIQYGEVIHPWSVIIDPTP